MVNPNLALPPQPVPEALRPDRWQFAALPAGELWDFATSRPIPIQSLSPERSPLALGLASTVLIPGVILEGGRQSRWLAQWIQEQHPLWLEYVPGELQGLILHSHLNQEHHRWVMATFQDPEVGQAGATYQERLSLSQGLHFLLVQPDNSGQTYTGIWLLHPEN
ncbi:MAG: Tab2 family RNA-binding protein [Prochlorotrichaceae cyanobacterium]